MTKCGLLCCRIVREFAIQPTVRNVMPNCLFGTTDKPLRIAYTGEAKFIRFKAERNHALAICSGFCSLTLVVYSSERFALFEVDEAPDFRTDLTSKCLDLDQGCLVLSGLRRCVIRGVPVLS